ncbi:hypothetical protein GCM10018783_09670 [Streptomyces griseosporeus]|nr:hypothetical protein GCM10018783_09670 [Streptomyces griseosporeus]
MSASTGQPGQSEARPIRYVGMFSMNAATRCPPGATDAANVRHSASNSARSSVTLSATKCIDASPYVPGGTARTSPWTTRTGASVRAGVAGSAGRSWRHSAWNGRHSASGPRCSCRRR